AAATAVSILGLLVTLVVFGVVLNLIWLLAPILVVEEGSAADALREGRALFREHRLRIFLYEGRALALGRVATLPLALPAYLATGSLVFVNPVVSGVVAALWGLVAGPLIAFLAVANVFVYLNLRYEYTPAK